MAPTASWSTRPSPFRRVTFFRELPRDRDPERDRDVCVRGDQPVCVADRALLGAPAGRRSLGLPLEEARTTRLKIGSLCIDEQWR